MNNTKFFQITKNFFNINEEILNDYKNIIQKKDLKITQNISVLRSEDVIKLYKNIYETYIKVNNFITEHKKNLIFDDLWVVESDSAYTKSEEVPFKPHIDKIRKFKIMIYVNDVDINSGPIHLIDENPEIFEKTRKNFSSKYKENEENIIKNFDLDKYIPCLGSFGTTIFFDTNTPHYAGEVLNTKKKRKILRFNYRYADKFTIFLNLSLKKLNLTKKNYFLFKN